MQQSIQELPKVFENLFEEYVLSNLRPDIDDSDKIRNIISSKEIDRNQEQLLGSKFLSAPCSCGKNCQNQFSNNELLDSRDDFRSSTWNEKNCVILAQLNSFQKNIQIC